MVIRQSSLVVVCVGAACLVFGSLFGQLFAGQQPKRSQDAGQSVAGQYQLVMDGHDPYLLDTTTGQCWERLQGPEDKWVWSRYIAPLSKEEK